MSKVRRLNQEVSGELESVVENFLEFCAAEGRSKDTLNSHRYALNEFFSTSKGLTNEKEIKQAVSSMLKGKHDAYYNKQLSALRKFFEYCVDEELLNTNPAIGFKYRRPTIQIVEHPEESIRALLKVINQSTFSGLRDYAFCLLMLDTGVRPNEVLQLQVSDFYFDTKQVRIRREYAKTRKERYLPVSAQTLQTIKKLISVRPDDWKVTVPVLCTYDGHRMPARNIQKRFREYSLMIKEPITPYHLRHIFGLWYIRNGGNAFSLQNILGHEKLDMTKVYVNLASTDVQENHATASPLTKFAPKQRVKKI